MLVFADIDGKADMASNDLADAEQMLAAAQTAMEGPIRDGIDQVADLLDALQRESETLEPVSTQLLEDLERYSPYANTVSNVENRVFEIFKL